jgi:hypothetical protein
MTRKNSSVPGWNTSKNAPEKEYLSMLKLLLFPDNADPTGGTPSATPSAPQADPKESGQKPPSGANPPGHNPAPPITAQAVVKGTKTERELQLENDLKAQQTRTAELEDRVRTLSTPPQPAKGQAAAQKKHFLDGGTFFHDE